jgi:serine palmitoyltransferase
VDEWTPEPLCAPLTTEEQHDLATIPVVSGPNGPRPKLVNTGKQVLNLASYNFTGLAGNETIKERAIETVRKYGVGSCGPPQFYGTIGMSVPSRYSPPRRPNGYLQTCTWTLSAT